MSSGSASARIQGEGSSTECIRIHGTPIPTAWLVQRHDSRKFPDHVITPRHKQQLRQENLQWAKTRDQWIAVAAAGVHLAMFAWNLAFWGSEGMPPDRYWPGNARLKMGVKPGRYGNLDGTKRIWYDNLSALEGIR